ncbi:MAG: malate synthase A [Pseudomonadota bacterium]|nr:malate synthase A [Pseudomonadota bacterium]
MAEQISPGVEVLGTVTPAYREILTPEAMGFVADLQRRFGPTREALLAARRERQQAISAGEFPDFLPQTAEIRAADWRVGDIPADLQDRRVEITGPTDRKMVINALNSGARVFMADFEDSLTPAWDNLLDGQINVRDAARRRIELVTPEGRRYALNPRTATLLVRPRGWHLPEKHVRVDGRPMSGSLFDFGLYLFHNARTLRDNATGPYFYLPKLESHLEARLWNDVFNFAQDVLDLPRGTVKATVLIETITAAFEMDEILYELKDHMVGLNCGRWDYIFSFIKKFHAHPGFVLGDRSQVTMTTRFLRAYSQLLIRTCHRRGAFAMGGMAAQIPIKSDPEANANALAKVRADKEREAGDGHDGTWVAHPGLVPVAMEVFDRHMPRPNQLERLRDDVRVTAADLLQVPEGTITEAGLRSNVSVGVQYLEAWLGGLGCVPLYNLMEDAATAEISRAQIWQWIRHPGGVLEDGRKVTADLFRQILAEELDNIRQEVGEARFAGGRFALAGELLDNICTADDFVDFLTLVAYEHI